MSKLASELGFSYQDAIESQEAKLVQTYLRYSLEKVEALLAQHGIHIHAFSAEGWSQYLALEFSQQTKISGRLVAFSDFVSELVERDIDLASNRDILNYFLRKHNLTVEKEFFATLEDGDVVEIYDKDFTQIFRNFKVLELTDYDLLRFELLPWMNLFGRHEEITSKLVEISLEVLKPTLGVRHFGIDSHVMQELLTNAKKLFRIHHRYIAPVFLAEKCVGLICTQTANLIAPESSSFSFFRKK